MVKSPPTIAATSTLAMVRTAAARGVETDDLLKDAGLSLQRLEDPDARIPAPTVLKLWSALRERAADPALQLIAPTSLPFGSYRVIDYLVASSATVGEGMMRFARFFGLIADSIAIQVEHTEDEHCLTLARADGSAVPPIYVDYVFAALVTRIWMRIRPSLKVLRVELRQPDPQNGVHAAAFKSEIRFGAPADRVCFSDEEWQMPTDSADEALARLMEDHARILAQRLPQTTSAFKVDVQKTIASALSEGGSASDVARAMHCSVRTLQRKLVGNGTTFRQESESVRGQLAIEYLSDRKVSIAEVAFLLGFSDQSAFNRAFRRWTGETPGRWRRQQAAVR